MATLKKVQTIAQLCSFHILTRLRSKSFKLNFSSTWTENFHLYKLNLEKAEEPGIKLPTFIGSWMPKSMARGDGGTEHGTLAYCNFTGEVNSFLPFHYLLKSLSKTVLLTNQSPLKSLYLIWCPEESGLFSSVQFRRSVVSDCDPVDYSSPGPYP